MLVNVAVATEGFDLPDASCIVLTRPTMSLALYLQMVGRGLRPKSDGGDCLVLDLAGNAEIHGLVGEYRQWSLYPRGNDSTGDAPVVRCEKCDGVSPAASHFCNYCQAPFGKDCLRCGKWRAFERWRYETHCENLHDLVCDFCHYDAHIQGQLPITDDLRALAELEDPEDREMVTEPGPDEPSFLRDLLEEERRRIDGGAEERKNELRSHISARKAELADDDKISEAFEDYLVGLPMRERPRPGPQTYRLYSKWEGGIRQELAAKRNELAQLEAQPVDKQLIVNNARTRLLQLFEGAARDAGLLPPKPIRETPEPRRIVETSRDVVTNSGEWITFVQLGKLDNLRGKKIGGSSLRFPTGKEISVNNWADLLAKTAEWLVAEGLMTENMCPFRFERMDARYLIHSAPVHPHGREFRTAKRLSNGLYIEVQWGSKEIARLCGWLVAAFGQDPAQFHVRLS